MINFKIFAAEQELIDFVNTEKVKIVQIILHPKGYVMFYGARKKKGKPA